MLEVSIFWELGTSLQKQPRFKALATAAAAATCGGTTFRHSPTHPQYPAAAASGQEGCFWWQATTFRRFGCYQEAATPDSAARKEEDGATSTWWRPQPTSFPPTSVEADAKKTTTIQKAERQGKIEKTICVVPRSALSWTEILTEHKAYLPSES